MSKINKFGSSLLALCFCTICNSQSFAMPKSTASYMVDVQSGKVLVDNMSDSLMYPASLTKVMTLYITFSAIEKGTLRLDDMLYVSRNAANRSPSKLGLQAGSKISVKDAIMALIVKSANDCATVLAENIGFSEENFAKTMTSVARELGMRNTTFKNASGLPNKQQVTTAKDMAILATAMYNHFPQYYSWFSEKTFTFDGKIYTTHNEVLNTFAGADGLKTGFTNAAGYNIITSAQRDGNRVIAVTMGHKSAKERDKKVSAMMDSGLIRIASAGKDAPKIAQTEEKKTIVVAKAEVITPKVELEADIKQNLASEKQEEKGYAIQLGAFSNYAKARKYAVQVNREYSHFPEKNIEIEAVRKNSAVVYRSRIVGFAQNEAQNACNDLKKENKSCIVVANANKHFILAQK